MQPNELQSYVRFMCEHLFDLVDIPAGNWHVPDGTLPIEQVNDLFGAADGVRPDLRERVRHGEDGQRHGISHARGWTRGLTVRYSQRLYLE